MTIDGDTDALPKFGCSLSVQIMCIFSRKFHITQRRNSKRNYAMQLRPKAHNFTLPHIHTTLFKNSFINRCIFDIVWSHLWSQSAIVFINSALYLYVFLDILWSHWWSQSRISTVHCIYIYGHCIFYYRFFIQLMYMQCDCHCILLLKATWWMNSSNFVNNFKYNVQYVECFLVGKV